MHEPIFTDAFTARFWEKVEIRGQNDCWPWLASVGSKSHYGHMWTLIDGKKSCIDAHRISWMIEHNRIPPAGRVIMHSPCNNKLCQNPAHLVCGSQGENVKAALRDGLAASKLNYAKARRIIKERLGGKFVIELASKYGVKAVTIDNVLHGKSWSDATGVRPREIIKPFQEQLQFSLEVTA